MDGKNDVGVTDEIENRLEELFEQGGRGHAFVEDGGLPEHFALRDLKATILSIDWEITDEAVKSLIEESRRLADEYKDDKNTLMFLRLLDSAGKYIRSKKANAHPDAIRLLNSVYNSLEEVFLSEGVTEGEKKRILLGQVEEFKRLKGQIALNKADGAKGKEEQLPEGAAAPVKGQRKKVAIPAKGGGPDVSRMAAHEAFAFALDEIKAVIQAEFRALRAELKLWREEE
ncbi:MAG: hypothetical protein SWH78_15645 [Thermodesulfobacteriota bacterium]|nr:hypothetical protein [Thermodesulfobacteriota bacterium]